MLRSLGYAAYAGLIGHTARRPEDWESLEPWARLWEQSTAAEFLRAYRATARGAAVSAFVRGELSEAAGYFPDG